MSTKELQKFIERMTTSILEAGELARKKQKGVVNIGKKAKMLEGDTNEVRIAREAKTIIDEEVQEILLKASVEVLAVIKVKLDAEEETPSTKLFPNNNSEITLVIDPIDGTTHYIAGRDNYSICVGLLEKDKILTALIYFPKKNHFYFIGVDGKSYLCKHGNPKHAEKLIPEFSKDKKTVFINYRVSDIVIQSLKDHGFIVINIYADWSEGILDCIAGKSTSVILYTPQVRDVLLGAILAAAPKGYAVDWHGNKLIWPNGGRVSKVMFGIGKPSKEILECLKES